MFIHESEHWPLFRWDAGSLTDLIASVSKSIGYLSGKLSIIGFHEQLTATVEAVTHDIIASSEIEGVILNTEEVRSSVARKLGVTVADIKEPTHDVEGMVEMMLDAVMNYDIPLTLERISGWHSALFPRGKSGGASITVGAYRTGGMQVVSGMFGRERMHYRAPEADRLPEEMESFFQWFNDRGVVPSLIKSAIAHFWFVTIHPFDDGNGRIARAISDMVLSQTDQSKLRFYSMSMQISREKKEYYRILERTQRGSGEITEWLKWYLSCLGRAVGNAHVLLSEVLSKAIFWKNHSGTILSVRQKTLLNIYLDGYSGKLTVKNWSKLAKVSLDTAARDIKDLVAKKMLLPVQGKVRDVSYKLNFNGNESGLTDFTDVAVVHREEGDYIAAIYKQQYSCEEKLSDRDFARYEQQEITLDDLVYKYFVYLLEKE